MGWCEFCQTTHSAAACYHPENPTHSESGPYVILLKEAEYEAELKALTAERDRLLSSLRHERRLVAVGKDRADHAEETAAIFHQNWVEFWSWFGREMPRLSRELWHQWKQHAGEWRP
ncbi:MAG: hypothetical protein ABSF14_20335 [Terriglobia bacterium]|jgi:hypothetical protein